MLIPFLLVLILLIANIGKFWHAKLDNRIEARTEAWRNAYFTRARGRASGSDELLTAMTSGSGGQRSHKNEFVKIIESPANQPAMSTGRAARTWRTWALPNNSMFNLSDSHSLDVTGSVRRNDPWVREEMPYGYDQYLADQLLGSKRGGGGASKLVGDLQDQKQWVEDMEDWLKCMADPDKDADECGDAPKRP